MHTYVHDIHDIHGIHDIQTYRHTDIHTDLTCLPAYLPTYIYTNIQTNIHVLNLCACEHARTCFYCMLRNFTGNNLGSLAFLGLNSQMGWSHEEFTASSCAVGRPTLSLRQIKGPPFHSSSMITEKTSPGMLLGSIGQVSPEIMPKTNYTIICASPKSGTQNCGRGWDGT